MAQPQILIVEDEAIVAADLAGKLERAGYAVVGIAPSGEQALKVAKRRPPNLVLMDIRLAGPLDGIDTADRLRAFLDAPVVFLTAHSDRDTVRRAGETAPFGYVLKPFDERDLAAQVEMALYKHRAERRLRDSEARYRALVETAIDGIVAIDHRGTVLSCNAAAERMFGYERNELLGRPISTVMPVPFREEEETPIAGAGPVIGVWRELTAQRRGGRMFPVEIAVSRASVDGEGLFTAIIRDVTERHAAHENIRRLAEDLEHRVKERTSDLVQSQERLRALAAELNLAEQRERKRLATELHDHLAQLLVLGQLKLAQAKRLTEVQPKCADLIAETAEVLDESLHYTRTLVADLSPAVLHDVGLRAALAWLAERMQRHELAVAVRWTGDDQVRLPEDQRVLLFQSVRELLMNVSKHAGSGRAEVSVERGDAELSIEVRDAGKGFDAAAAERSTTPVSSKFGLFSIRERMKAMGGRFDLQSASGKGTTARLIVPIGEPEAGGDRHEAHCEAVPTIAREAFRADTDGEQQRVCRSGTEEAFPLTGHASPAQIRVLLVDDHVVVRQGLRSLLESYADVDVVGEAGDGLEAVAMSEALRPEVVLMDVNMPKMDGIEATTRIKSRWPSPIVIGLSMHSNEHYEQRMKKAGAAAYLSKESAGDSLHEMIMSCRLAGEGAPGGH